MIKMKRNRKVEKMIDVLAAFSSSKPLKINWDLVEMKQNQELRKIATDLIESACCKEVKWLAEEYLLKDSEISALRDDARQLSGEVERLNKVIRSHCRSARGEAQGEV